MVSVTEIVTTFGALQNKEASATIVTGMMTMNCNASGDARGCGGGAYGDDDHVSSPGPLASPLPAAASSAPLYRLHYTTRSYLEEPLVDLSMGLKQCNGSSRIYRSPQRVQKHPSLHF